MNESAQTTSEGQGELTGGADPTKGGKAPKRPIPGTLTEFLQSDYQASAYANALTKGSKVTRRPDEADRAQALLAVGQNPALLSRVAELARLMLEKTESIHLTEAIKRFASDAIRAQDDDLVNWGNNVGCTADTELGKLAARVNGARASGDKDVLQRAEHVLQIGLAVVSTRADFDPIAVLAEINTQLGRSSGQKAQTSNERVKKEIVRASLKNLETFGAITASVTSNLRGVQRQFAQAVEQIAQQTERSRMQREQIDGQREKINALESENQSMRAALTTANTHIKGIEGGRDIDLNVLRARFRKFLAGSLSELVDQALEALTSHPPAPDISEALLDDARTDIKKELQWLNQHLSSD